MTLRRRLEAEAAARHWKLCLEDREVEHLLEASISLVDWHITITLHPHGPGRVRALLSLSPSDGGRLWEIMAETALRHEMGHWDVCPFSGEWNAAIMEGIGEALMPRAFRHREAVIHRVANCFCDLIVNATLAVWDREPRSYAEGVAVFLVKEWALAERTMGLSAEYRVFLGAMCRLMVPGGPMGTRLAEIAQAGGDPRVRKAAAAIARSLLGQAQATAHPGGRLADDMISLLLQRGEWKTRARQVATILAPFLRDEASAWQMSASVTAGGFSQRPTRPDADGGAAGDARSGDGRSGGSDEPSVTPPGPPTPYAPGALEDLYRRRAAAIVLEFDRGVQKRQEYPAAHFQTRRLADAEAIQLASVRWAATRFVPAGPLDEDVWIFRKDSPHNIPLAGRGQHRALPDLAFLVDSSGSMGWEPYAGCGEYDLVLRTVYSVFRWLETHRVGYYLHFAALNFSSRSWFSGWHGWHQLEKVKRVLFAHQGENTVVDTTLTRAMLQQAHRQFAAVMITDGEIRNTPDALKVVEAILRAGNGVTLIQLGGETRFSQAALSLGVEVHLLASAAELPGLVLGGVRRRYESPARAVRRP